MPKGQSEAQAVGEEGLLMPARRLDVRPLPTWGRHPGIFAAFDAMPDGEALIVVTDHEPVPLRAEFEASRAGRFAWAQRHIGEHRWDVTIRRIALSTSDSSAAAVLARCGVFGEAHEQTREAAAGAASEHRLAEGAVLFEQDADWPYLGIVAEGTVVAIVCSDGGREQTLFTSSPSETFGEVETLDGGRTIARLVAAGAVRVLLVPRDIVLSLITRDAGFALALAAQSAQRTRVLAARLSAHVSQPTVARVAAAILPYASPDAGLAPTLAPLRRMTQNQLAIAAGTVKEVVARCIAELEAAGALKRETGRIAYADRRKLLEFVGSAES